MSSGKEGRDLVAKPAPLKTALRGSGQAGCGTQPPVPSGTAELSPARKRWVTDGPMKEAPGGAAQVLAEQVSRSIFNAMPPQNGTKFLLEGEFAMVLLLISDVANHRGEV